jgi:hypothetical protein
MRATNVFRLFLLLLVVFTITHGVKVPGTPRYFTAATGGQKIFDMQPSSSAAETWDRLERMGPEGRALYQRTIITVDLIFPVTMLLFLVALASFAARRSRLSRGWTMALVAIPVAYFGFDLLENLTAWTLLHRFPERLDGLGGAIGNLTRAKRATMISALTIPHLLLLMVALTNRFGTSCTSTVAMGAEVDG